MAVVGCYSRASAGLISTCVSQGPVIRSVLSWGQGAEAEEAGGVTSGVRGEGGPTSPSWPRASAYPICSAARFAVGGLVLLQAAGLAKSL